MKNAVLKKALLIVTGILASLFAFCIVCDRALFDFYPRDGATAIKQFKDNRDDFFAVQRYAAETKGLLYVSESRWRFKENKVKNTGDGVIQDPKTLEMLNGFLSKLHYKGIYEWPDGTIRFIKEAGSYESGIAYSQTEELSFYVIDTEVLGDGWYYYQTIHE